MSMKKNFLTWVLMKYGVNTQRGGLSLREEYARSIGVDVKTVGTDGDYSLAYGDYPENGGVGLDRFLGYDSMDRAYLKPEALGYINEP
jgi:hypothetical protein